MIDYVVAQHLMDPLFCKQGNRDLIAEFTLLPFNRTASYLVVVIMSFCPRSKCLLLTRWIPKFPGSSPHAQTIRTVIRPVQTLVTTGTMLLRKVLGRLRLAPGRQFWHFPRLKAQLGAPLRGPDDTQCALWFGERAVYPGTHRYRHCPGLDLT